MDKLRRALSGDAQSEAEEGGITEIVDTSSLSYSTRIKGFAACFLLGFLFSILGAIVFFFGNVRAFAVFYTLGSFIGISSTMFLMGPVNQFKKMCAPTRFIATIIMFVALVLTLMAALYWKKTGLTLILIIIQFLAMTWYSLSYIPYARDAVIKLFNGLF